MTRQNLKKIIKFHSFLVAFLIASPGQAELGFGFKLSGGVSNTSIDTSIGSAEIFAHIPFNDAIGTEIGFAQSAIVKSTDLEHIESKISLLQTRLYFQKSRLRPWIGLGFGSMDTIQDNLDSPFLFSESSSYLSQELGLEFKLIDRESFKLGLFGLAKRTEFESSIRSRNFQEYGINLTFIPTSYVVHNSYHYSHDTHVILNPDILFGFARIAAEIAPKIARALSN